MQYQVVVLIQYTVVVLVQYQVYSSSIDTVYSSSSIDSSRFKLNSSDGGIL